MYQRENNGLGCKVRTKQASKELNATNSIKQAHGERSAICSSSDIRCVLNATALAKWLTTSSQSSKVAIRWNGTTYKRCVIDVTI